MLGILFKKKAISSLEMDSVYSALLVAEIIFSTLGTDASRYACTCHEFTSMRLLHLDARTFFFLIFSLIDCVSTLKLQFSVHLALTYLAFCWKCAKYGRGRINLSSFFYLANVLVFFCPTSSRVIMFTHMWVSTIF